MSVFAQILMIAYYLVYTGNVSCDDAFGCTVYFNSLSGYRKSTKIKKNCIGSLYHFSITHTNHSFSLYVWFDFFQTFMSTTSSPPSPLDNQGGTVPVSEVFSDPVQIAGFTGKSSLKVKLKQEEGVQGPKVYQSVSKLS